MSIAVTLAYGGLKIGRPSILSTLRLGAAPSGVCGGGAPLLAGPRSVGFCTPPRRSGVSHHRPVCVRARMTPAVVRDGTYRTPVSGSNAAPPQFAAPTAAGTARTP